MTPAKNIQGIADTATTRHAMRVHQLHGVFLLERAIAHEDPREKKLRLGSMYG